LEGTAAGDLAADDVLSAARLTRATRLLGAPAAQREALGRPLQPAERQVVEGAIAAAQVRLGDMAYAAAVTEGRVISLEQAVAYALDETGPA
jgi:hypothetical protein